MYARRGKREGGVSGKMKGNETGKSTWLGRKWPVNSHYYVDYDIFNGRMTEKKGIEGSGKRV